MHRAARMRNLIVFSEANIHGRSVAAYRRAMALAIAGRCDEEKAEPDHFAPLTKPADVDFVRHERTHLRLCKLANAGTRAVS